MKVWKEFISNITQHIPSEVECEIKMMNSINSLTRFANSHIHQNVEEETSDIFLTLHKDQKTITLTSNLTSISSPKDFVQKAISDVENSSLDTKWGGIPDSSLSFEGFREAQPEEPNSRAEKVKDFIDSGKGMNAAGYCSTSVNNYFVWNSNGLNSSDTNTSSFIDGIFRTETSAGSSH